MNGVISTIGCAMPLLAGILLHLCMHWQGLYKIAARKTEPASPIWSLRQNRTHCDSLLYSSRQVSQPIKKPPAGFD